MAEWEDLLLEASELEAEGRHTEAARVYEDLASSGCLEAYDCLAQAYLEGRGVVQSSAKAVALYEEAIERGFVRSMHNLGAAYCSGYLGLAKDEERGIALLKRAAILGNTISRAALEVRGIQVDDLEK